MKHLIVATVIVSAAGVALATDLPIVEKLVQQTTSVLETHIGGQVFKVTRSSPLPNAFGRADIFGRTVDRGSIEMRYQGQTADGKLVFRLVDIDVRSNETTMNRTPATYSEGTATANASAAPPL